MSEIIRHAEKCDVTCVSNKKVLETEVMDFKEHKILNVVVNKSVKLNMIWNGKIYEGRSAGMDFTSNGPKISRTQTTLRG